MASEQCLWAGGCYGWGFEVEVPQTGERVFRVGFGQHAAMGKFNTPLSADDRSIYSCM